MEHRTEDLDGKVQSAADLRQKNHLQVDLFSMRPAKIGAVTVASAIVTEMRAQ